MRLSLNKNALKQQRDQLAMYRRYLPSLDLKRQQLLGAWKEARQRLAEMEAELQRHTASLDRLLPLLGSTTLATRDLSKLVRVKEVTVEEENVVGAHVPVIRRVEFTRAPYSTLALPFWVDQLVESLEKGATLRVTLGAQRTRVARLEAAARKITQRVNLFDKVLIPTARKNIKRIDIALSDEQRASVVRSKLAKHKNH
jgi:V/A-type H+-transporting ATPase subunit D